MSKVISEIAIMILLTSMLTLAFNIGGGHVLVDAHTLIMGTTDSVERNLDPASAYDFFGWEIIRSLGSGLVEFAPGATGSEDITAALATSWSVSSDSLEWTFHLRQGVLYDDNSTEFNATHVKYSFDRGIDLNDPDGPFVGIGYGDIIENVTIVSKYVVKFYLKIPFAQFLSLIACQASYIVDPEYAPMATIINYTPGNARASHPMGLGPYRLKSWTRVAGLDSEMNLEANPNYWNAGAGLPKTKNVLIKFYADSTGLALAITREDIDVAFRRLTATDIDLMKTNPNLKVWQGTGAFIQYLVLQQKYAPFNVTEIRQAVAAAINRTTIVQTVFQGQAEKLYSLIPNGMSGHTDAFLSLGNPNYTRTRELLNNVGYNETHKLTFKLWYESSGHYPQSAQLALVLKSSIEASGVITVTLDNADWAAYRTNRINEVMDAYILGWYPDYVDPDRYVFPFLHSSGSSWLHHNYNSSQMDTLVAWARANTSMTVRNDLYDQIQTLMADDCPIVPLYQGVAWAVTKPDVEGVYLDITQSLRIWYLQMPPEPPEPPARAELQIRVGTTDSVAGTLDPAQAYDYFGWCILQQIAGTLVSVKPGSTTGTEFVPELAESWDNSDDATVWNFTLRKGITFPDGTEFNATHVKYSFDRAIALIPSIPEGAPAQLGYDLIISSVEVLGTYKVRFHLNFPFSPFLSILACRASAIVDPKYAPTAQVNYTSGDPRASTPVAFIGPYNLSRWVKFGGMDMMIQLDRNPYYWNATGEYPKTDRILFRFYSSSTALRLAIEADAVDVAFRHISQTDVLDLEDNPNVKVWWGPGTFIQYLCFQAKRAPFNDTRVRVAVAAALNRTAVCNTVFLGLSNPLYSIIPPGMLGHTEAFRKLGDANYTLTRGLLADVGYNETDKLKFDLWYESSGHYPRSAEQAVIYKQALEASGVIEVTLKSAVWPSYRQNRNDEIMDSYIYGWYPDYVDPDNCASLYWASWLHLNYENQTQIDLYDQARATTNTTLREELYAEIDEIALQECSVIPLWVGSSWAVTTPSIYGLCLDITQDMRYWIIEGILVGDITGPDGYRDRKVDMRDVGLVARHFGQTVPPAPAKCDLTGPTAFRPDRKIDMRDVDLVARHFGNTYP